MTDTTSGKAFNNATGKTAEEDAKRRAIRMMKEKQHFEEKAAEHRAKVESAQTHEKIDLECKHDRQKAMQDEKLQKDYGDQKTQNAEQLDKLKAKAKQDRLTQDERDKARALQKNLEDIERREKEQRDALQQKQNAERRDLDDKQKEQAALTERTIHHARQNRQAAGWKPAPVVFDEAAVKEGEMRFQKPAQSAESSQGSETAPKTLSGAARPVLAPKGARTGVLKPAGQEAGVSQAKGKGLEL